MPVARGRPRALQVGYGSNEGRGKRVHVLERCSQRVADRAGVFWGKAEVRQDLGLAVAPGCQGNPLQEWLIAGLSTSLAGFSTTPG